MLSVLNRIMVCCVSNSVCWHKLCHHCHNCHICHILLSTCDVPVAKSCNQSFLYLYVHVCLQLSLKGESTVQYRVLLRGVVME